MIKPLLLTSLLTTSSLVANEAVVLENACQAGDAKACYEFALPLTQGDNAKSQDILEKGMSYMRKACLMGENKGCDTMGEQYFKDKNYGASIAYLTKSCERNIVTACEAMGTIYRDALDTKQDDIKSRQFYEKACDLKSGNACFNVAIIYRGGFGVEKSRTKEKEFYKKGCNVGLKAGCSRFTELDNEDKGIETGILATIKKWFK